MRTINRLFSGLRFRLVLLVALASLPPVVLTLYIARQDRQPTDSDKVVPEAPPTAKAA